MPSQPPTPYDRNFNFTEFGQIYPTKPLPGNQVDIELNDVQLSINGTITRLNLIQNDDGTLKIPGSLPWYQQFLINVADANNAKNLAVDAAASAAESADLAGTSELDAYTHAQAAQASAGEALSSSQAASASADAAGSSASGASTYATMAGNSAAAAATSASEAAGYAQIVNPANYIPQPTIPAVDGQILAFNGTDWVALDNYAQVLQETVRNETGATLAKGTVVYISGASGNKPLVAKAQANSESGSSKTFAVLSAAIANNNNGNAVTSGLLRGLDLSAYTAGAPLWLSPTVPGGFTPTKPVAPDHAVFVGWVVRSHATQGELLVKIQNGYELGELHDVSLPSPADGQVLKFEAATGLWKAAAANPFDQSLNTSDNPSFNIVYGTEGFHLPTSGGDTRLTPTNLSFGEPADIDGVANLIFTDATTQTTAGLSPAAAAATYYPLTNPSGYVTAATAPVTSVAGKTGAVSLAVADVSGAAPTASPTFTGNPQAPTPAVTDDNGSIATTAFTQDVVDGQRVYIQTFGSPTTSGTFTWSKPAGAKMVQVRMVGGGGGGAGGECRAIATSRAGGGGGSGGTSSMFFIPASELPDTVTVLVGAGGVGGAGRNTAGAINGASDGGFSGFGNYRTAFGSGALTTSGGGGFSGSIFNLITTTAANNGASGAAAPGSNASGFSNGSFHATGGGGGGGLGANITTSSNGGNGGSRTNGIVPASFAQTLAGGSAGIGASSTPASNGSNQDVPFACGTGGGGGFCRSGFDGGNGGNGGWPGGGGGGGGASDNGFLSGAGGNGANGMVTVITYF